MREASPNTNPHFLTKALSHLCCEYGVFQCYFRKKVNGGGVVSEEASFRVLFRDIAVPNSRSHPPRNWEMYVRKSGGLRFFHLFRKGGHFKGKDFKGKERPYSGFDCVPCVPPHYWGFRGLSLSLCSASRRRTFFVFGFGFIFSPPGGESPSAKVFFALPGRGCFAEGACGPAFFKGKSFWSPPAKGFFTVGFVFFPLRGGSRLWRRVLFALPGRGCFAEWACGPAHFALRAHLAFGKSLFLSEQKK